MAPLCHSNSKPNAPHSHHLCLISQIRTRSRQQVNKQYICVQKSISVPRNGKLLRCQIKRPSRTHSYYHFQRHCRLLGLNSKPDCKNSHLKQSRGLFLVEASPKNHLIRNLKSDLDLLYTGSPYPPPFQGLYYSTDWANGNCLHPFLPHLPTRCLTTTLLVPAWSTMSQTPPYRNKLLLTACRLLQPSQSKARVLRFSEVLKRAGTPWWRLPDSSACRAAAT